MLTDKELTEIEKLCEWANKGMITTFVRWPDTASQNALERHAHIGIPALLETIRELEAQRNLLADIVVQGQGVGALPVDDEYIYYAAFVRAISRK